MKITIANRWTGAEIFSIDEVEATVAKALLAAIKSGADLSRANLSGADLSGADLSGADLSGANLSGANLSGANLSGAKIDGEEISLAPLCVSGLHWWVLVTDGYMRIGCQRHTHQQWNDFTPEEIAEMADNAASFWLTWKQPLIAMCTQHAAAAKAKVAS